jgi:two-component system, OmpR family, KDP operon response regulator KdpE
MTQPRGRTAGPPARPATARGARILIVEDEPALLRALRINLRARGYDVIITSAGRDALAEATRRPPDAVLLDLGLPDVDGTEVIRELRGWSAVPVIVLSGRAGSGDRIGALDAGADDYVTKPFDMEELVARLRAVLRRDDRRLAGARLRIGRSEIDLTARTAIRYAADGTDGTDGMDGTAARTAADPPPAGAQAVHLTRTEWRLLEILLNSPGQLISSDRLLSEVWGPGYEHSTHYLRFHMAGLRRKLEDDPPRPRHLLTEPGMGYRYQP